MKLIWLLKWLSVSFRRFTGQPKETLQSFSEYQPLRFIREKDFAYFIKEDNFSFRRQRAGKTCVLFSIFFSHLNGVKTNQDKIYNNLVILQTTPLRIADRPWLFFVCRFLNSTVQGRIFTNFLLSVIELCFSRLSAVRKEKKTRSNVCFRCSRRWLRRKSANRNVEWNEFGADKHFRNYFSIWKQNLVGFLETKISNNRERTSKAPWRLSSHRSMGSKMKRETTELCSSLLGVRHSSADWPHKANCSVVKTRLHLKAAFTKIHSPPMNCAEIFPGFGWSVWKLYSVGFTGTEKWKTYWELAQSPSCKWIAQSRGQGHLNEVHFT